MFRLLNKMKKKAPKNQHSIPLRVLRKATNKFDDKNVIGSGGFGKVYSGTLEDGTKVAVKRKKPDSNQGESEFRVETELLSRLNHPNLVSLIGYCDEKGEMILVYEYMEEGTLKSHLYGSAGKASLSWEQRLEVSVGAAEGLHYLHTTSPNGFIHRDVKSENILLDENLCAKVGDFGLSKSGPELNQTHVVTHVKGTPGYFDPEYLQTQQLTMKSDVYSFGVVLLEVLCGRPVFDPELSEEKASLVCWGKKMLEEGKVEEIVDEKILGTINPHYLTMFGNIVLKCLAEKRAERPTMEEVLRDLQRELDYVHGSSSVAVAAAGNSDDESHHRVSSQPVRKGTGKTLKRSEGRIYERVHERTQIRVTQETGEEYHFLISSPHQLVGCPQSLVVRGGVPSPGQQHNERPLNNLMSSISIESITVHEDGNPHESDHA